jgi:hypothetical protein
MENNFQSIIGKMLPPVFPDAEPSNGKLTVPSYVEVVNPFIPGSSPVFGGKTNFSTDTFDIVDVYNNGTFPINVFDLL